MADEQTGDATGRSVRGQIGGARELRPARQLGPTAPGSSMRWVFPGTQALSDLGGGGRLVGQRPPGQRPGDGSDQIQTPRTHLSRDNRAGALAGTAAEAAHTHDVHLGGGIECQRAQTLPGAGAVADEYQRGAEWPGRRPTSRALLRANRIGRRDLLDPILDRHAGNNDGGGARKHNSTSTTGRHGSLARWPSRHRFLRPTARRCSSS